MTKKSLLLIFASLILVAPLPSLAAEPQQAPSVYETKLALRDLWVEHVFWVRNFVIATQTKQRSAAAAAEAEIVANAQSIAATLDPFYGEAAKQALFQLLAGHWSAIKAYNAAVIAGDKAAGQTATDELVANAHLIAAFLAGANPNLPEDAVFSLLAAHGGHHIAQIEQVKANNFVAEAETWAAMRKHMFVIADAIVEALALQFPEQF